MVRKSKVRFLSIGQIGKLVGLAGLIGLHPREVLAQSAINLGGNITGIGNFGTGLGGPASASSKFMSIISTIIGVMTVGAGIWFIFNLLLGAITWIGAAGDKAQLQTAQRRITSAIIGLVIVVGTLIIAAIMGSVLDFPILNIDLTTLVP